MKKVRATGVGFYRGRRIKPGLGERSEFYVADDAKAKWYVDVKEKPKPAEDKQPEPASLV